MQISCLIYSDDAVSANIDSTMATEWRSANTHITQYQQQQTHGSGSIHRKQLFATKIWTGASANLFVAIIKQTNNWENGVASTFL